MSKELRERSNAYQAAKLPRLRRLDFDRIEGTRVELMRRSSRGAFKTNKSPHIRVATGGRTFLEMLRDPEPRGCIQHVLKATQDSARSEARRGGTECVGTGRTRWSPFN